MKDYIRVPYAKSVHGSNEISAVVDVLNKSTQMGKNVELFEKKISKLFNKKYGLMVNSGSSALLLAIESLNLPSGSEVITPVLTFSTTISYLVKNNLKPIFVDVKKDTFCINEDKIINVINKKTKVILAPNLIGNLVDWKKIKKITRNKNIIVIEDSADTLGSKINNKSSGYFTDISTTSFYGSHIINCAGNGGMVCYNNLNYYKKAKLLRSWGRSSSLFKDSEKIENRFNIKLDGIDYDKKFVFEEIGHNLEPSEIGAAFGLEQLKKLIKNIKLRQKYFNMHQKFFKNYNKYFSIPNQLKNSSTAWLAYPLMIKDNAPFNRKELQIFLEKRNIQTRVVFTGNILRQPGYKFLLKNQYNKNYQNADNVMKNGILLACHNGLNQKMLSHFYSSFEIFLKQFYKQ